MHHLHQHKLRSTVGRAGYGREIRRQRQPGRGKRAGLAEDRVGIAAGTEITAALHGVLQAVGAVVRSEPELGADSRNEVGAVID